MTSVAIIASAVGNLTSVQAAVERLGRKAVLTKDPDVVRRAAHVLFPGVGHAAHAMADVRAHGLDDLLPTLTQPLMGICMGMQLLFERSAEGEVGCLGLIPGRIEPLPDRGLTLPHMGWNQLEPVQSDHPLLRGVAAGDYVYFVHSFYAAVGPTTVAAATHGVALSAIVARGSVFGCQFHVERSGPVGARILANFLDL